MNRYRNLIDSLKAFERATGSEIGIEYLQNHYTESDLDCVTEIFGGDPYEAVLDELECHRVNVAHGDA